MKNPRPYRPDVTPSSTAPSLRDFGKRIAGGSSKSSSGGTGVDSTPFSTKDGARKAPAAPDKPERVPNRTQPTTPEGQPPVDSWAAAQMRKQTPTTAEERLGNRLPAGGISPLPAASNAAPARTPFKGMR